MPTTLTYTAFGKTKQVEVTEFHNMTAEETPDEMLWVERSEDYYALLSPRLKNKKVAIITRSAWLNGKEVEYAVC